MATTTIGGLTNSDTTFNLTRPSAALFKEYRDHPILSTLVSAGVINREDKLDKTGGDTVRMFNMLRNDSGGYSGDADRYSNAKGTDYGNRDLSIALLGDSKKYRTKGSFTQQIASWDLSDGVGQSLKSWLMSMMLYSVINQLGGNTATSIAAPYAAGTSFSGSTGEFALTKVTGNNSAIAPSSDYKAIGALGTGGITTDQGVDADNVLTLRDFQLANEVITSASGSKPLWNLLTNTQDYHAIALVSATGMNQLKNEATTQGQGVQIMQVNYAKLAGGKAVSMVDFVLDGIRFIQVPDHWMPRGVHSGTSAAVANTRRAVIVGANALDLAFGAGYQPPTGDPYPGFSISVDPNYKPLNKETYVAAESLWGCKKAQIFGSGANASTAYDLSTYVITHYSRT
jgi:hypothetical protein